MTSQPREAYPMTHLTDQDGLESVQDHLADPAPHGLIARLQATVKRAAKMPKWVAHMTFTLDDADGRMSASIQENAEAGWDAYVTRWKGTVRRVGHQLTLEGAICVCESYMAKLVRDA